MDIKWNEKINQGIFDIPLWKEEETQFKNL